MKRMIMTVLAGVLVGFSVLGTPAQAHHHHYWSDDYCCVNRGAYPVRSYYVNPIYPTPYSTYVNPYYGGYYGRYNYHPVRTAVRNTLWNLGL